MDIKEVWQALKYDSGNIDLIKAFRRSMTTLRIERLLGEMEADKARIAELEAQLKTANELITEAVAELTDAPEINPCNYDHDQVCRLNTQCNYVHSLLSDYANTIEDE